jgi:hypothetical protein
MALLPLHKLSAVYFESRPQSVRKRRRIDKMAKVIAVKYFSRSRTTIFPFCFDKGAVAAAVEMWETRMRFPRPVESGVCFPSARHFHGRLGLFMLLLWPSSPVRPDNSGC